MEGEVPMNFICVDSSNAGCAAGLEAAKSPHKYAYRFLSQGKGEKLEYSHI